MIMILMIISDCKKDKEEITAPFQCPPPTMFDLERMKHYGYYPLNSSIINSTSIALTWNFQGKDMTYDVYFGTNPDPSTNIPIHQTNNSLVLNGLDLNTTYYWSVTATENFKCGQIGKTDRLSFTTVPNMDLPYVITAPVLNHVSAPPRVGGNVLFEGTSNLIERGYYWDLKPNPELNGNKIQIEGGSGLFSNLLPGLNPSTTYYIKAYAINSSGTAFGSEVSFTTGESTVYQSVSDIEGNVYYTVNIGTQVWMAENLRTTLYSDATAIPNVTENYAWNALSTPGYCWYNNDIGFKTTFGALYNWYAVNSYKLCPAGWHVPSDAEWTTLSTFLGGDIDAVFKLKESDTFYWNSQNMSSDNSSGFSALPGGERTGSPNSPTSFDGIGTLGIWWSSHFYTTKTAIFRSIFFLNLYLISSADIMQNGFSVRCLKDN